MLDGKQQERLFQLRLQQARVFALLGQNEAFLKLMISDEQRKRFVEVVQEMEKKIQAVLEDVQDGTKPEDILAKVRKLRKEHEAKIEALMTDSQKKQWSELLGKSFELSD